MPPTKPLAFASYPKVSVALVNDTNSRNKEVCWLNLHSSAAASSSRAPLFPVAVSIDAPDALPTGLARANLALAVPFGKAFVLSLLRRNFSVHNNCRVPIQE